MLKKYYGMYTRQHREIGSYWDKMENDSRRNILCSHLNKPDLCYSLFKCAGQDIKKWYL